MKKFSQIKAKNLIIHSDHIEVSSEVLHNLENEQALLMVIATVKEDGNKSIRLHINNEEDIVDALVQYAERTGDLKLVMELIRNTKLMMHEAEQKIFKKSMMN